MCLDTKVISDFLPATLTVVGWGVAAWLAIKQINIAHEKNRELQEAQNIRSLRSEIYKQFLPIYMDIFIAANQLNSSMSHTHLNMSLDNIIDEKRVLFGWKESMDNIDKAYLEYCKKMELLEIWLPTARDHISKRVDIEQAIKKHKVAFTVNGGAEAPWAKLQTVMVGMKASGNANTHEFSEAVESIQKELQTIRMHLRSGAEAIQSDLLGVSS